MAAANESQGLKIAVASFVSLSVILAVTSYFLYSNYSAEAVKSAEAESKAQQAQRTAADALRSHADLREKVGGAEYKKYEKSDDLNTAIKRDTKTVEDSLNARTAELTQALGGAGGAKTKEVEKAQDLVKQTIDQYVGEPNATYNSRLSRLAELTTSYARLCVALWGDLAEVRQRSESVDTANDEKVKVAEAEAKKARDEQTAEHAVYEQERKGFLDKLASLTEQNGKLAAQVASLNADIERINQDNEKRIAQLTSMIKEQRNKLQKEEKVLGHRQGVVTYVDWSRKEVRTTLSRSLGAREMMRFSLFDQNAGLPSDRAKATIELLNVDDRGSVAKVITQLDTSNPIRVGDQVYSAAFGQKSFALVGKMDINRDGKDDRGTVKRMIEMAGGIVSYDLPPPNRGPESGTLNAMTDWIVTDELGAFGGRDKVTPRNMSKEESDFLKRKSDIVAEARTLGISPMPLHKLAGYLGYSFGMVLPGGTEAYNRDAARAILQPRGIVAPAPAGEKKEGDAAEAKPDAAEPK